MTITKFLLCFACLANMNWPTEALADYATEDDIRPVHASSSEGYQFSYSLAGVNSPALQLAVNRPDGSAVDGAHVIIALIDRQGRHHQVRAETEKNRYRVDIGLINAELCRIETEVIADGQLLTDHFHIDSTT